MAWFNLLLASTFIGLFIAVEARVVRRVKENGEIRTETKRPVKNALLIHSGVMRNYQKIWPLWEQNFINPSKKAGVQFTIAVSTDLRSWCDPDAKDAYDTKLNGLATRNGELATKNGCACMRMGSPKCAKFQKDVSKAEKAQFTRDLQKVYGRGSKDGTVHVEDATAADLPTTFFNSVYTRAQPILKKFENQTFDYIIVSRPDIVLANSRNFSFEDDEWNLASMCDSHPGLNLISGAFVRNNDEIHHRDWDWGYVLCDGAHVEAAKPVLYGRCGECYDQVTAANKAGTKCVPPTRSKEWQGNGNWTCHSRACSWFQEMQEMKNPMRFGNLDDTLFGLWPRKTKTGELLSHRDAGENPYKLPTSSYDQTPMH